MMEHDSLMRSLRELAYSMGSRQRSRVVLMRGIMPRTKWRGTMKRVSVGSSGKNLPPATGLTPTKKRRTST